VRRPRHRHPRLSPHAPQAATGSRHTPPGRCSGSACTQ
jgi:hypothetical protein